MKWFVVLMAADEPIGVFGSFANRGDADRWCAERNAAQPSGDLRGVVVAASEPSREVHA